MSEEITVYDSNDNQQRSPENWSTWDECRKHKTFVKGLIHFLEDTERGGCAYPAPMPIQAYAWPILMGGKDLIGVAKTGSGKTLAFLLPGFIMLRKNKKSEHKWDTSIGPAILVMTPTRELCQQIFEDAEKFGGPVQISAACAYGGAKKNDQLWRIKGGHNGQGTETLIATPGRLNDFMNNGDVKMDVCHYCVLDEADRMLDMGFEPQIKEILARVPKTGRQMSMFTATWNRECRKIAEQYINDPWRVQVGANECSANQDVVQQILVAGGKDDKVTGLKKILKALEDDRGNCLVFSNTKKGCANIKWDMENATSMKCMEIHGDLDQWQRTEALDAFRQGTCRVLIATDVAARGLDIRNVKVVVNWDPPNNIEDYVHRIGRTGRAGDKGVAYTFLSSWGDDRKASQIAEQFKKCGQRIPKVLEEIARGKSPDSNVHNMKVRLDGVVEDDDDDGGGGWGSGGGGGNSWDKDDWKKDSWSKDSGDDKWKKDDDSWKKDDNWKKEDDSWKKDDKSWKKDDDSWKKDDDSWKKDDKKDSWSGGDWKKEADSWKSDAPPKEPAKKADWWEHDDRAKDTKSWSDAKEGGGKAGDDMEVDAKEEADQKEPSPADANFSPADNDRDGSVPRFSPARDEAPEEEAPAKEETFETAGKAWDLLGSEDAGEDAAEKGTKRAAPDEGDDAPPAKAPKTEAAESPARPGEKRTPEQVEELLQRAEGSRLTVVELKEWLGKKGHPINGLKAELVERATKAVNDM